MFNFFHIRVVGQVKDVESTLLEGIQIPVYVCSPLGLEGICENLSATDQKHFIYGKQRQMCNKLYIYKAGISSSKPRSVLRSPAAN